MKNYYVVTMNGKYMNSFVSYTEACEFREELARKFRSCKVEVEPRTAA